MNRLQIWTIYSTILLTDLEPEGTLFGDGSAAPTAGWQPSVSTAWRSWTVRSESLTGQSPFHVTAASQRVLQLPLHFDAINFAVMSEEHSCSVMFCFFGESIIFHYEVEFISVNPKATWPSLWFGYGNTKTCFRWISNGSHWTLKTNSLMNVEKKCGIWRSSRRKPRLPKKTQASTA